MMKKLNILAIVLAAGFGLMTAATAGVSNGAMAPDFELKDSTGETHSLSDFKGKKVVLEWTNHQCPFVVKHYKNGDMQKLQKEYTDKGVVWLSIVSSGVGKQGYVTPEEATALIKKQDEGVTAKLLDPTGKVGKLYGAKTTPHMFVIDPDGKVAYQGAIDSIKSTSPADVAKADNYVMAALDSLIAGKTIAVDKTKPYGCGVKYAKK